MNELLQDMRRFWYNNEAGPFRIGVHTVTRREISTHGGPAIALETCPVCHRLEWLSRVKQRNLFMRHDCAIANKCKERCQRQGDELWTHFWQDFWFAVGCDPDLNAPRALVLWQHHHKARLYERFWQRYCDFWMINFRRLLGSACQVDVVRTPQDVNWEEYDFLLFQNLGDDLRFPRPPVPIVMLMYDIWIKDYQGVIDRFQPEHILTPYPQTVKDNFRLYGARVHFHPLHASSMFTRPNLDPKKKKLDLLTVGSTDGHLYTPRLELDRLARPLKNRFRIEFSHHRGSYRYKHSGPVEYTHRGKTARYLNKWSEHLGTARFAAFAGFNDERYKPLFAKYFELFGSGAAPIVPETPDLRLLGVEPMVHYIPLSRVWGDRKNLAYVLGHYGKYRHIAENAVRWHEEYEGRLFGLFEGMVRGVTEERYPRRLRRRGGG